MAYGPGCPKQGDAMDIMKKVAANTAAATESRRQFVYHQRIRPAS